MYSFLRNIHLVFSNSLSCGDDLTVDIRKADPVIVYKVQCADSASCKSLDHITSDSSYTENGNTGCGKLLHSLNAV